MPGIGGFKFEDKNNFVNKQQELLHNMRWDKNYLEEKFASEVDGVALVASCSSAVPISKTGIDQRYYSLLIGEIYPVDESTPEKKHVGLVKGFIRQGADYFNNIDGVFLISIWDAKEKTLTIANDQFGRYPLNFYHDREKFIFSSQIKAIIDLLSGIELNEQAFTERLALGFPLNGKTFFQNIRRLFPGSYIQLKNGILTEKQYFHPYYVPQEKSSLKSKLNKIYETFSSGVLIRNSAEEKTAVALSGGFDTRLIWSVFLGKKLPATAITHGDPLSADVLVANQISKQLNFPHEIYHLKNEKMKDFPVWAEKMVQLTEGFMNVETAFIIPYYKWLQQNFDLLIDGAGGAMLRRQHASRYELPWNRSKGISQFIFQTFLKQHFIDGTISPEIRQENETIIINEIKQYFTNISKYGANEDLLDLFYLQQIVALLYSADFILQTHYINCREPFYDRKTFEIARTFTSKERRRLYIHKYIIRKMFRELEQFPLELRDFIIPYKGFLWKRSLPIALHEITKKTKIKLITPFKKAHPLYNSRDLFRNELKNYLKEILLDPLTQRRPFWSGERLEKLISEHEQGSFDHSRTFFQIITAELFLREFFK